MIRRAARLVLAACTGASAAGCILDLDHLTGGSGGAASSSSSSAASSSSSSSGGAGGGAPDGGCPLLDCTCDPGAKVIAGGAAANTPRGIAVAGGDLIWASRGSNEIRRLKAGDTGAEVLAAATLPRGIAVAGSTLVWTADDGVYSCTLPSCADGQKRAGAAGPGSLRAVGFDGQNAVWTDRGTATNDGRVQACALPACDPIVSLDANLIAPEGVALAGTDAFWVDTGNGNTNGSIKRSPKTTSAITQIAGARNLPDAVAVDDTYAYWTESVPGGHVYRCALADGYCNDPEDIAPAAGGLGRPYDVRVGNGRVYWSNADDGTILSCPAPGCGADMPKIHVAGRAQIGEIAIGSSCVFWAEDGGGAGAIGQVAR